MFDVAEAAIETEDSGSPGIVTRETSLSCDRLTTRTGPSKVRPLHWRFWP